MLLNSFVRAKCAYWMLMKILFNRCRQNQHFDFLFSFFSNSSSFQCYQIVSSFFGKKVLISPRIMNFLMKITEIWESQKQMESKYIAKSCRTTIEKSLCIIGTLMVKTPSNFHFEVVCNLFFGLVWQFVRCVSVFFCFSLSVLNLMFSTVLPSKCIQSFFSNTYTQ